MSIVAGATKQLQQHFISSRFSSSVDEWPPYQPKHYTTLAFIHNKGKHTDAVRFSVAQELAVAGNINLSQPYKLSDLNANMTKNISDIFLPIKTSDGFFFDLHILIEGAPGIGKTVLAKEIAYQWAKCELLTSKKLLFLVFLRECSQTPLRSIEQLVYYVFKNDEMVPHVTNYLSKTAGEDAIIVFDGFDELSEDNRKESIIIDIINRRILAKCCLVITSRPTASSSLHGSVDRRVEIVGFTEEDRLDYIQTALENCEQVKALQKFLQSNPTINALCYIPLNMTILLYLAEDGIDKLPKTQTEIYKKFIQMTIVRFIKKYENCSLIISIDKLPHPHDKLFVELAKLAYEALKVDKIVFTLPEIKEGCPNLTMTSSNWNGLGLLKAVQCFNVEMGNDQVTFHFLHFSVQEYMAAWYISTLSGNKQIKLLKETFWEHRFYNTWIMYVGITSGSTFALRHFLSGNRFQFYSKLFKKSKISNEYLKNKMKCLHLFQCLVEANKEGIMKSVNQLFQNNQIDLSDQTLLPSDLNTLSFFLVRSINKEWDELDLSNCNIGRVGCNILCDGFLDKGARCIVTIKMINFSCNQLNCSSLIQLFGLFNSWHTSEIIITDEAILDIKTDSKAIEDIVLQSDTLMLVFIGSCLYSRNIQLNKMVHILSNTTNIKSMYLLNCNWSSSDSKTAELLTLLDNQKLDKVRIIGPSLDILFITKMAVILLNNNDSVNMFVYDPTMPDEIADDISSLISSSNKDITGVMLIVGSSKVQGIVNTSTLSNELSALELFNLDTYVRLFKSKYSVCSWRDNFKGKSYNKESIVYTFVKMLYIIKSDWQLEIAMIENDVLIANNTTIRKNYNGNISMIYFSSCSVYHINESCSVLHSLNSPTCVTSLHTKLLRKQSIPNEVFIYGDIEDSLMYSLIELISHHHHNISATIVVNDVIVGVHPNIQQIALALQLQPSPIKWVLCTPVSAIVFHQVVDTLVTLHVQWIILEFTCCDIGDIEYEVLYRKIICMNHSPTVKKLNISFNKLSVSGIRDLVRIILMCGVQELNIHGTNDVLYDCLIKNLTNRNNHQNKFFLSITYSNRLIYIVCNTSWNEIVTKRNSQVSELYMINCELQLLNSKELVSYLNISHNLLKLSVINGAVSETVVLGILKLFSNKFVEVSISNVGITDDDRMIRYLLTSYLDIKLNLVLSTNHWLCVCNATKYQLHLIHQYFAQLDSYGMSLIRKLEQINGNKMYMLENNLVTLVRLCAKAHQTTGVTDVIVAISNVTSLTAIEIDNYSITSEAADHLANIIHNNTQLQEISLNGNNLQTNSVTKIAKALYCIQGISFCNNNITHDTTNNSIAAVSNITRGETSLEITGSIITTKAVNSHDDVTLTKLCISNNHLTDEAADDISTAISCNIHLQELNLGNNNLQTPGIIKIAKGLQKISFLQKLYINHNNITDEAADIISTVISCNIHLQELNLGNNNLQTPGIIKIAKDLQKISSLTKLYINHNNITDEASEDIAAVISCSSKLQEFDVSGNNLQTTGVIKIVKAFKDISTLRKLYLSNVNITDEVVDDIVAAISCNAQIEVLDVSGNHLQAVGAMKLGENLRHIYTPNTLFISNNNNIVADDVAAVISGSAYLQELYICKNNFQTTDAKGILKALQGICTLTKIHFGNNNISDEAANDIAAIVSANTKLKVVEISGSKLQTTGVKEIMKALQGICTLQKLYLNNNNITEEAGDDIAAAILCNIHLQELNLGSNKLQASGTIKIAKSLQKISSLTKLYINHNNITDEAADDIAVAISCNIHLQELHLGRNRLQASGTIKIAKSLQKILSLTKLYINHNNITYEAADDIAVAISCNIHLQELNLGGNKLQASGTTKIAKSLQKISSLTKLCIYYNNITDEAADDIAVAISYNIHLQELNLGGNKLQASGTIKIAKCLQKISSLTKLCIYYSNITDEAADDIAVAISCNIHLQELDLGGNKLQASGTIKIAKSLQKISSLTKLYINHNNITDEAADDIAVAISCNIHLQELNLGSNKLQASGTIKIAKSLQKISSLTKLYINLNHITDEAADDIAVAISCNIHLQELDLGGNKFQASGTIKIAKSLQKISSLTKLYINLNHITDEAADDIAVAISCNIHLQELDLGGNKLQASGTIKIAKSLQKISSLTKLCIYYSNITDEAADDIAVAISCNIHLQELDLSGNKLQASGTIKIAKSLQKISSLTKLCIYYSNTTDEAADDIAVAISCNIHLQELDLGGNKFQASGTIKIAKSLQKISSLTKLYINLNHITDEAADDIAVAISCNIHLQELDLGGNKFQASGTIKIAKSLQKISSLTKLYINLNHITDEAADDIAVAISCNIHLQELDLGGNKLQASGTIKIAKSLQKISSLTKLRIYYNNITEEAADDIAVAISCNIHLQELHLSGNELQASGTIKIAKSLQKISSLTKLYINHNNITDEAADDIAVAISCNIHLQELDLGGNKLQASGTIKIAKSLQKISSLTKLRIYYNNITEEAADDIAVAISCNIHLQELHLSGNELQASGTIKIAKSLQKISSLTKLYINHNNITDEAADDIAVAISCNIHLQELDLGGNKFQASGTIKLQKAFKRFHH